MKNKTKAAGFYRIVCRDPLGKIKWIAKIENLIVNVGLDYLLDVGLVNGSQIATWYIGLLAGSPTPLAGWTAASLAAVDFTNYDEATLQAFVPGSVAAQSVDNVGNEAVFTIDTNGSTIGGVFLISTNAKAVPAGTLYSAGAFTLGNKSADDDDTLTISAEFTMADDA